MPNQMLPPDQRPKTAPIRIFALNRDGTSTTGGRSGVDGNPSGQTANRAIRSRPWSKAARVGVAAPSSTGPSSATLTPALMLVTATNTAVIPETPSPTPSQQRAATPELLPSEMPPPGEFIIPGRLLNKDKVHDDWTHPPQKFNKAELKSRANSTLAHRLNYLDLKRREERMHDSEQMDALVNADTQYLEKEARAKRAQKASEAEIQRKNVEHQRRRAKRAAALKRLSELCEQVRMPENTVTETRRFVESLARATRDFLNGPLAKDDTNSPLKIMSRSGNGDVAAKWGDTMQKWSSSGKLNHASEAAAVPEGIPDPGPQGPEAFALNKEVVDAREYLRQKVEAQAREREASQAQAKRRVADKRQKEKQSFREKLEQQDLVRARQAAAQREKESDRRQAALVARKVKASEQAQKASTAHRRSRKSEHGQALRAQMQREIQAKTAARKPEALTILETLEPRQQFLAHGRFAVETNEGVGRSHFDHIPGQMYPKPFVVSDAKPDFTTTASDMKKDLALHDYGQGVTQIAARPREWRPKIKAQWYYGETHIDPRWAANKNPEAEAAARFAKAGGTCHSPEKPL